MSDGELIDTASVTLTIIHINDEPVLEAISDITFDEDQTDNISLLGNDVDNEELVYSITTGTDIIASLSGSDVIFSAPANFNGSESFTATVSDGELSASQSFTVTVTPVNDAPVATADISAVTDEDQSIVISLSASDIDGDNLIFSLDSDASNGLVIIDGSIVTYTPDADYNGEDSFVFTVSDGEPVSYTHLTLPTSDLV